MNYYIRNIDEYARETKHLSLQEHGIYFLLLDHYYTTEKPIPADKTHTYRIAYARTKKRKARLISCLIHFLIARRRLA